MATGSPRPLSRSTPNSLCLGQACPGSVAADAAREQGSAHDLSGPVTSVVANCHVHAACTAGREKGLHAPVLVTRAEMHSHIAFRWEKSRTFPALPHGCQSVTDTHHARFASRARTAAHVRHDTGTHSLQTRRSP